MSTLLLLLPGVGAAQDPSALPRAADGPGALAADASPETERSRRDPGQVLTAEQEPMPPQPAAGEPPQPAADEPPQPAAGEPPQPAADEPTPAEKGERRWTSFSEDEVQRMFVHLAPKPLPIFAENGVETVGDEVIMLEPYVVEGDRGPLLPWIRRELELGPETLRRRVQEMAPRQTQVAAMIGRNTDRFFADSGKFGPADRPEMLRLNNQNVDDVTRSVGKFFSRSMGFVFRR